MQNESQRIDDLLRKVEFQGKWAGWLIGLLTLPILLEIVGIMTQLSVKADPRWILLLFAAVYPLSWYHYRRKQQQSRGSQTTAQQIAELESQLRRTKQVAIAAVSAFVFLFFVFVMVVQAKKTVVRSDEFKSIRAKPPNDRR
ncbi:MAG TPA: hypothetical protein VJB59_08000 [Bdellovibrionota bacterium]|nr:hypothetical protein [Bdellovibrionota bacterium]